MRPTIFEKDGTFWYETLRAFSHIAYGGADFGEVLSTVQRIAEGDYDSWHDEWLATADRIAAEAGHALARGHRVSARDGFLRAANYYRCAGFFPGTESAHPASVACFRTAISLWPTEIVPVEIPYEGTTLPGYFYRAGDGVRPTVVVHNGFDGTAEEMHFVAAAALVERGYHVLSFDGPGQPGPLHREGLVFRPDWEHVVTPVLDHLVERPEVDDERIALLGNSLGGLLAPRAAAFEPRIKALVALDGVYDMGAAIAGRFGGDRVLAKAMLTQPVAPELDEALDSLMADDPSMRWAFRHGMRVMGVATPRHFAAALLDYHLRDGIAERVACPTLVCAADDDFAFLGQPEELHEHLTCPKTFLRFTAEEGADAHCQAGAQRLAMARIGDWLAETL